MKITARQYAVALAQSLEGKEEEAKSKLIQNFIRTVFKRRQTKLLGAIVRNFSDIYKKQEGIIEAEVVSAFPIGEKEKEAILEMLAGEFSAKKDKIILLEKIDPSLIGGVVIFSEGCIWDMSVSGGIKKLEKSIK